MAIKILYFGTYDPEYSRNRVINKAFKGQGVSMVECRVSADSWGKWLRLIVKHWRLRNSYDLMLVGFPGQEIMFLARALSRKPIIFDAFTSHYEGYVLDRRKVKPDSLLAHWYRLLDKLSCSLADLVLLDTNAHIGFFVREFGLAKNKFRRLFVGTDTDVFKPVELPEKHGFTVHFHGRYIPLQGVQYIVKAAKLLENERITFNLIGKGQVYEEVFRLANELRVTNVNFINPVPYSALREYMAKSDLCLGIFGDTSKAQLVIPNKIYEALAMARPVLTAKTPAIEELLIGGEDAMLCLPNNPDDIAEKIRILMQDRPLRERLAKHGHDTFALKASESVLGIQLLEYARELLQQKKF